MIDYKYFVNLTEGEEDGEEKEEMPEEKEKTSDDMDSDDEFEEDTVGEL